MVEELHRELIRNGGNLHVGGKFEWVDGQLVQALKRGHWLLIDNVNFCRSVCINMFNQHQEMFVQIYAVS